MNKLMVILFAVAVTIGGNILSGCAISNTKHSQDGDEEILSSIVNKRCIDFRWYGTNHWNLREDGWHSSGGGSYEVLPRSNEVLSHGHAQVLLGREDSRLIQNPGLLYCLFDSDDTEVVLTAIYCYSEMPTYDRRTKRTLISRADLSELASQLRKLLSEHRDVRIRCMAADVLRKKAILDIGDIDLMLSDKDLSVQILGIECVYLTRNLLEHGLGSVPPVVFRPTGIGMSGYIERKQYYRIKKQLIPILLKHLNDNHFYIRAACYQSFATLVERHRPSSDGRYSIEKPKTLPNPIQWERESWWNCRDEQRKLLSWWEDNGEFVLRNYGPDWIAPAK